MSEIVCVNCNGELTSSQITSWKYRCRTRGQTAGPFCCRECYNGNRASSTVRERCVQCGGKLTIGQRKKFAKNKAADPRRMGPFCSGGCGHNHREHIALIGVPKLCGCCKRVVSNKKRKYWKQNQKRGLKRVKRPIFCGGECAKDYRKIEGMLEKLRGKRV